MATQPKRKAANGEGTIQHGADGRHRAIISLGIVDGTRKRRYGTWREKEKDARTDLRKLLHERDQGVVQRTKAATLAQFVDQWLTDVVKPTTRYSTWRLYRARIRIITKAVGHIKLTKLTAQDVQSVLRRMSDGGYSDHAIHGSRNVLINALGVAEEWELVTRNVAKRTKVAPVADIPRPVLSEAAVKRLVLAAWNTPVAVAVHLGILGLRSGEVCALTWQDVDWQRPAIRVHGTRVYAPGGYMTGPTKTPRSTRTVPIPAVTVAALRAWKEAQAQDQYDAGDDWEDTRAILTNRNGRHLGAQALGVQFHRALDSAALPQMRFHDLRHSSASLMAAGGVQVHDRRPILGHTSDEMALRYTHGDEESLRAAVEVLGRALTVEIDET